MKGCILVIGNSSIDCVVMSDGYFYRKTCGGNSIHASMAASNVFDGNVYILTNLPLNFPVEYCEALASNGVDTSLITRCPKNVEWDELFVYSPNGDRLDGVYINGYEDLDGKHVSKEVIQEIIGSARNDVYSLGEFRKEYPLNLDLIPKDRNITSIHLAPSTLDIHEKALMLPIPIKTVDPGRYLIDMDYKSVCKLASKATVFAPSKKEMGFILPGMDLITATRKLGMDSNANVVCKNGGDGCILFEAKTSKMYRIGTFSSKVKDLTGAGDSFGGAMNAFLAMGDSLVDAVRKASVVAAKAIEDVSAVRRNKVDRRYVEKNYLTVKVEEIE